VRGDGRIFDAPKNEFALPGYSVCQGHTSTHQRTSFGTAILDRPAWKCKKGAVGTARGRGGRISGRGRGGIGERTQSEFALLEGERSVADFWRGLEHRYLDACVRRPVVLRRMCMLEREKTPKKRFSQPSW
jgi:hypothetical protein